MEEFCNCKSIFFYAKKGVLICSECNKPTKINIKDLKPMTEEEIKMISKEVIKNENVCFTGEVRRTNHYAGN